MSWRNSRDEASLRSAIRKAFTMSSLVKGMKAEKCRKVPRYKLNGQRHKVDSVEHFCEVCQKWVGGKFEVDHKIPVVDPEEGYVDIHTFIKRLYCEPENLSLTCHTCHAKKTAEEWKHRRLVKAREALEEAMQSDDDKKKKKYLKSWTEKRLPSIKYDENFMVRLNEARATYGLKPLTHQGQA